jgi:invasion protein IalB
MVAGVLTWLTMVAGVFMPSRAASLNDSLERLPPEHIELAQAQTGGSVAPGSRLPGGASSLSETYGNWRVACAQQGNGKRCALSQVQTQQNGQRVLAIELNTPATGNTVSGTLIMPFGLALDSGVIFQIDEKPAMQPVRFRTCLPAGCLVNVTFDAPALVALRAGAILKIKTTADGGAAAPFSISLQGFGTALDCVAALAR